jgi:RNA polymerase sigma-70 factor (ECF subfamily)
MAQVIGDSHSIVPAPLATVGAARPVLDDESRAWLHALAGDGRDEAVVRLRALLLRAARFEAERRRDRVPHVGDRELDVLAIESADAALTRVTSCLGDYRGGSRFTTWAAKFAILETSVVLRRVAWREAQASPNVMPAVVGDELGTLTADQRHVFEALVIDGVPIDVLVEAMQRTRADLYRTLHDARAVLRRRLSRTEPV